MDELEFQDQVKETLNSGEKPLNEITGTQVDWDGSILEPVYQSNMFCRNYINGSTIKISPMNRKLFRVDRNGEKRTIFLVNNLNYPICMYVTKTNNNGEISFHQKLEYSNPDTYLYDTTTDVRDICFSKDNRYMFVSFLQDGAKEGSYFCIAKYDLDSDNKNPVTKYSSLAKNRYVYYWGQTTCGDDKLIIYETYGGMISVFSQETLGLIKQINLSALCSHLNPTNSYTPSFIGLYEYNDEIKIIVRYKCENGQFGYAMISVDLNTLAVIDTYYFPPDILIPSFSGIKFDNEKLFFVSGNKWCVYSFRNNSIIKKVKLPNNSKFISIGAYMPMIFDGILGVFITDFENQNDIVESCSKTEYRKEAIAFYDIDTGKLITIIRKYRFSLLEKPVSPFELDIEWFYYDYIFPELFDDEYILMGQGTNMYQYSLRNKCILCYTKREV